MAALAKPRLLRRLVQTSSASFSTKGKRAPSNAPRGAEPAVEKAAPPRPPEMPWMEELANSVRLTGSLKAPVRLQMKGVNGGPWAVSVLFQEKTDSLPQLWTPLTFEDELAESAACHLKVNDLIYVSGQLKGDPQSSDPDHSQANFQVLVKNFHFVLSPESEKEYSGPSKDTSTAFEINEEERVVVPEFESKWMDLILNHGQWWDYRQDKANGSISSKFPDFKHKSTGQGIWVNRAPVEVLKELEKLTFDTKDVPTKKTNSQWSEVKTTQPGYEDLISSPDDWWDFRGDKLSELVSSKHPDFKHKITQQAVWIGRAPEHVRKQLEKLKFDTKPSSPKKKTSWLPS